MNVFLRALNLLPAILAAVQMVEALPHIQGSDNKKAAALAIVKTGLAVGESAVGHPLLNHPAFDQVAGDTIDAVVAMHNLSAHAGAPVAP